MTQQALVDVDVWDQEHDPVDLAWAGGLFVGEGCVTIVQSGKKSGNYRYLKIDVRMYDEFCIRRFIEVTGAAYTLTKPKNRTRFVHCARAVGRSAERILGLLWPYLEGTEKQEQAVQKAAELDIDVEWINGKNRTERPQRKDLRRGRKPKEAQN